MPQSSEERYAAKRKKKCTLQQFYEDVNWLLMMTMMPKAWLATLIGFSTPSGLAEAMSGKKQVKLIYREKANALSKAYTAHMKAIAAGKRTTAYERTSNDARTS